MARLRSPTGRVQTRSLTSPQSRRHLLVATTTPGVRSRAPLPHSTARSVTPILCRRAGGRSACFRCRCCKPRRREHSGAWRPRPHVLALGSGLYLSASRVIPAWKAQPDPSTPQSPAPISQTHAVQLGSQTLPPVASEPSTCGRCTLRWAVHVKRTPDVTDVTQDECETSR